MRFSDNADATLLQLLLMVTMLLLLLILTATTATVGLLVCSTDVTTTAAFADADIATAMQCSAGYNWRPVLSDLLPEPQPTLWFHNGTHCDSRELIRGRECDRWPRHLVLVVHATIAAAAGAAGAAAAAAAAGGTATDSIYGHGTYCFRVVREQDAMTDQWEGDVRRAVSVSLCL